MAADQSPTDRLKEIRERLDAAAAKDRPDCGPFTATPEGGTDPYDHELAMIFGPDGDQLGTVHGNLGLDIDGDALAEMWAHANTDLAWLLGEVKRLERELKGAWEWGDRWTTALTEISEIPAVAEHLPQRRATQLDSDVAPAVRAALEPRND